jgi:hypothetical protein
MSKVNVGITLILKDPKKDSLFSNGIRQNVVLLQEIYKKCYNVENSYIVNVANVDPAEYKDTSWEKYQKDIIPINESYEKCDVIVVCHSNLTNQQFEKFKKNNKKVVFQVLGAELSIFNEKILFENKPNGLYQKNKYLDAVWVSPHFFERDKYFFEQLHKCPVYEAPYIWSPQFMERDIKKHEEKRGTANYIPNEASKKISVMEPNLNMVKTSIMPIIISEKFFNDNENLVKKISIFGSDKIKLKKDFVEFVNQMNSYTSKKLFFESRYPIVWTLSSHTDIVLCHQNGCELNYLYLDAAWLGYPIVHNSPMMKDLGWYYPENNATIAVEHLQYIAKNFDNIEYPNNKYLEKSRKFALRYTKENPENIKGYEKLIELLFSNKK